MKDAAVSMSPWRRRKLAFAQRLRLDVTHAQVHYARYLRQFVRPGMRWLEIGCGRQVIPEYAEPLEEQRAWVGGAWLVGVDVDGAMRDHPLLAARVEALGGALPFSNGSFDLASSNMVVEHVTAPEAFLADVFRVLKPGGRFVFHTPNLRHYMVFLASLVPDGCKDWVVENLQKRSSADRFRTMYRLNTARQIRQAAARAGFRVEQIQVVGSNGYFSQFGLLAFLECLVLKTFAALAGGNLNSNLIVTLRRPAGSSAGHED